MRSGTPPEIVRKLNAALNTITARPEVVAQFRSLGEWQSRYIADIAKMKDIVARAKMPPAD